MITNDNDRAPGMSRRRLLELGAGVTASVVSLLPSIAEAQQPVTAPPQGPPGQKPRFGKTDVWVQLTTGGKPYPPTLQEMFLDPMFLGMNVWPIDQPASFAALLPQAVGPASGRGAAAGAGVAAAQGGGAAAGGDANARGATAGGGAGRGATPVVGIRSALGGGTERLEPPDYPWEPSGGRPHPGYDVLVLNDQMNWPDATKALAKQAVEAGRGFVLLHYSLGDNQDWAWWYQEVTGGLFVLADQNGMKKSVSASAAKLDLRPVGKHPILRNIEPFTLSNEEAYKGMWQSPKITPLLQTANAGSDTTVAWVGVHPTTKVVCIQPGLSRETHHNPAFRMLVRNAILWAAGRAI